MDAKSSKRATERRDSAALQGAFEFLVGKWICDVRIPQPDGATLALRADWRGLRILGQTAILDEFTLWGADGAVVMRGVNIRVFDVATQSWSMKWLNATEMQWFDLGPEELGGVRVSEARIEFQMRHKADEIHRIVFSEISPTRFRWQAARTLDEGRTWSDAIMTIEARRA